MAQDHDSEATRKSGQLEIRLRVFQAALHEAEEETSVIRAWLAKSDATVAGKISSMNASILISTAFYLDSFLLSVIVSPDSEVGVPPTSIECGHGYRQCLGSPYQRSPPRHSSSRLGNRPPRHSSWCVGGADRGASLDRV